MTSLLEPTPTVPSRLHDLVKNATGDTVDQGVITFIDGRLVLRPSATQPGVDVAAAMAEAERQFAGDLDIHGAPPKRAAFLAEISRADGVAGLAAGTTAWVVAEVDVATPVSGPAGTDGTPVHDRTFQASDRLSFIDAVTGRFLGAVSVPSGTDGSEPTTAVP